MSRIRIGATALGLALLALAGTARAQETTGRITGRVTDQDTNLPLGGVTVIVAGPQGEDAVVTSDKGEYTFTALPIGTYVIRFYAANTTTEVEQSGVVVAADRMVRVNAKISGAAAAAAAQQTYLIAGKAPTIDIGSARIGAEFDRNFMNNVPLGLTYGDVIERAPGAFVDGSGNVSIGGATGLENIYLVNGINVTGLRYGNLENGAPTIGGGSNLPLEFLNQVEVNSGGYGAEFGGAMGGVVNTVLRSGSNEFHGSVFGYWSPYWLSGTPNTIVPVNSALTGVRKRDFDDMFGVEVGGPIIKDKLFFWVGFAPQITNDHVMRLTYAQTEAKDAMGNPTGQPVLDANGAPVEHQVDWTARIPETHRTYYYAGTLDFIPLPDNKLTLSVSGTPSFNQELKGQYQINALASDPRTAVEEMTRANTDVSAHWMSKLLDRRWQIDALAGMHSEYLYGRSPYSDLNSLNEVQYGAANLWDLEHANGCAPSADGFQPCPVNPFYQGGGFGEIDKSSAFRWTGEVKGTNIFEAGGHHEVKYGWHLELATFDLDRNYSGPPGGHSFEQIFLPGNESGVTPYNYNSVTLFTLQPGETPAPGSYTDLTQPPNYVDLLHASVKSLSDAFFLQDSYSPDKLRNLTVNAGVRLELQTLYGSTGTPIFDTNNWAPRLSAVYDPFSDGRSKLSVSYGRYYEQVPLDVAARYFGGENFVQAFGPITGCNNPNPYNWVGAAEYKGCPPPGPGQTSPTFNSEYAQPNMQGQYHNEIVATAEREVMEGMTVRLDYQHRWLGNIIEDGYGPAYENGVLANPGNVSSEALQAAQDQVNAAKGAAAVAQAQYNLATLQALANAPKPERNYDAITLSVNQRFTRNWLARAAYTYSRLIGNYEGLYQQETNYFAPNGNNAYDTSDLYVNQNGPLPNDHPHLFHLDGFYRLPVGKGQFTFGLSFSARSGTPRNYMGNLLPGGQYQVVFLLPRGDAGRTPTVTQLNGKIAYGRPLGQKMSLEGFIDLFNIFNQQTAILTDDNYTFETVPPIVNGTTADLKFAKSSGGAPIVKNPNFGQPLAYQDPFSARLGLRLSF